MFLAALSATTATTSDVAVTEVSDPDADKIVATIGSKSITVADFLDSYSNRLKNSDEKNRPTMKDMKEAKRFLTDLLTIQAVLISAEEAGYPTKPEIANNLSTYEDSILTGAITQKRCKDMVVSDDDVKNYYEKGRNTLTVRYILCDTKEDAQKVADEAHKPGAKFEKLAEQYSVDPNTKKQGGLVPAQIRFFPVEPFETLFNLAINEVSNPVELPTEQKWAVFRLEKTEPVAEYPEYEKVQEQYRNNLIEIEKNVLMEKAREDALAGAKVERDQSVIDLLFKGSKDDWGKEENLKRTVSKVDDRPITFKLWYESATYHYGDMEKARIENQAAFEKGLLDHLRNIEKGQALLSQCYKEGLDKDPKTAREIRNNKEKEITFAWLADNVENKIPTATEAQVMEYYEKNKENKEYRIDEKIVLTVVTSPKKELLEEVNARLAKGEELDQIVEAIGKREKPIEPADPKTKNPAMPPTPAINKYNMEMKATNEQTKADYEVMKALKPGEWSTIIEKGGSFIIASLLEIQPERIKTFEEAKEEVQMKADDLIKMDPATDAMCVKILQETRDKYPIKINDGVLNLARKKAAAIVPPPPKEKAPAQVELSPEK